MPYSASSPLITRRNGKTQACEPCRRRKVACDHGYPVCRRCQRLDKAVCYYARPGHAGIARSADPGQSHTSAVPDSHSSARIAPEDRLWSSPAARAPTGYLGPTSYSAAYSETETNLAAQSHPVAVDEAEPTSREETTTPPSVAEMQHMESIDRSANHLAVGVLQALPASRAAAPRYRRRMNPNDEWTRMVCERVLRSTWETFGAYLRDRRDAAKLREMGSILCINTRKPLDENQDDPGQWIGSFSGPNLRWEAVGMVFMQAAFTEMAVSTSAESKKRIDRWAEYGSSCITLATMGGSSGTLMLLLLYERSVLHAYLYGKSSKPSPVISCHVWELKLSGNL